MYFFVQMSDGTGLGDSSSVLDFMSMKNYPDMSLDMSMLSALGNNHEFCGIDIKVINAHNKYFTFLIR